MNGKEPYAGLKALCGGKPEHIAELMDVFILSTSDDLKEMHLAVQMRRYVELQRLAHRVSSACLQLGEMTGVAALRAIEYLPEVEGDGPEKVVQLLFAFAESVLSAVLVRASEFHSSLRPLQD